MKRLFVLTMVMVTLIGVCLSPTANADLRWGYTDLSEDHWAYDYISTATFLGIMNGYPDKTFKPEQQVTLGEYLKTLCCIFSEGATMREPKPGEHWATPYAENFRLILFKRVNFTAEDYDSVISRGLAAKYTATINAGLRYEEDRINHSDASSLHSMIDHKSIPEEYRVGVDYCIQTGIMNGFEDGTFRYDEGLTRAQAAKIILLARENLDTGL